MTELLHAHGAVAKTASKILGEWCRPDMDVNRFAAFLVTTQVEGKDGLSSTRSDGDPQPDTLRPK